MYEPSLRDRVRIALGLVVLQTKPDDISLETHLLHLRSSFTHRSTTPKSDDAIGQNPTDLTVQNIDVAAERAWLDRIKRLESEVISLKRKLVETELDASTKLDQTNTAHASALAQAQAQAQAQASSTSNRPAPPKRQKKTPNSTAKKFVNPLSASATATNTAQAVDTSTQPAKRRPDGHTNTTGIRHAPQLIIEYGRFHPPPGRLFPGSQNDPQGSNGFGTGSERELESVKVNELNESLTGTGNRTGSTARMNGIEVMHTNTDTSEKQTSKQRKKPGPKVGWKTATGNTNANANASHTSNAIHPDPDPSTPLGVSDYIDSMERTTSTITGTSDGKSGSGNGSGGEIRMAQHALDVGVGVAGVSGPGNGEGKVVTAKAGAEAEAGSEGKGDLGIIGAALDRLMIGIGRFRPDSSIDTPAPDQQSFGILEALLLPAGSRSSTSDSASPHQAALLQTELDTQVMFDCATSVINKLGSLLEACIDISDVASSQMFDHVINCPKPIVKLVFRILDHVLAGIAVKFASQTPRADSDIHQRGWVEIMLLVQRKICVPAIGSLGMIGLAIYTAMGQQSEHVDVAMGGTGPAGGPAATARVLPARLLELDSRQAVEISLIGLAQSFSKDEDNLAPGGPATIAEIVATSAMVELVNIVNRAISQARNVHDRTDNHTGSIAREEASKETIFCLCRLISAMVPLLPLQTETMYAQTSAELEVSSRTASATHLVGNSIRSHLVDALAGIMGLEVSDATMFPLGPFVLRALLRLAERLMLAEGEQGIMQRWLVEGLQAGSDSMSEDRGVEGELTTKDKEA